MATIAILTSAKESPRTGPASAWYEVGRNNYLAEELTRRNHQVVMWWDEPEGELLAPHPDLVVIRSGKKTNIARARALADRGIRIYNDPDQHDRASDKWITAQVLTNAGIPHPPTTLALGPRTEEVVVLKQRRSSGGHGVEKIRGDLTPNDENFIVQPLLAWDDDLRATVIDRKVVYTLRRRPAPGEWRTNLAQGAHFENAGQIPTEAQELAIEATRAMNLSWGGVDLLLTPGGWTVLEVNPGTTLYGAHPDDGLHIVSALSDFLERELRR